MSLIRQVLVDRQLSFDQANMLVNQKYIADIFNESEGSLVEEDATTTEQDNFSQALSR